MFEAYDYFQNICNSLYATAGVYKFTRSTGLPYMEELLQNFKSETAFFTVDDTNDGMTIRGEGGGFFDRRQYVVFLIKKYKYNDMDAQHAVMEETRGIYRSIESKLLKDRVALANNMAFLHLDRMPYYEIPGYAFNGAGGLYFIITVDQPKDLQYDANEWCIGQ